MASTQQVRDVITGDLWWTQKSYFEHEHEHMNGINATSQSCDNWRREGLNGGLYKTTNLYIRLDPLCLESEECDIMHPCMCPHPLFLASKVFYLTIMSHVFYILSTDDKENT